MPFKKAVNPKELNESFLDLRLPSEFERRPRNFSYSSFYKAKEWRHIGVFLFPLLVNAIKTERRADQRHLINEMAYLLRVYAVIDDKDFDQITPEEREYLMKNFMTLYQRVLGIKNMVYNTHVLTHLEMVRILFDIAIYNGYRFETYYSQMVRSYHYTAGSKGKSIFQKLNLKTFVAHQCKIEMQFSDVESDKIDDTLIYIEDKFFKILAIENEFLICYEIETIPHIDYDRNDFERHWAKVGVWKFSLALQAPYLFTLKQDHQHVIRKDQVEGKAICVLNYIMKIPKKILLEGRM